MCVREMVLMGCVVCLMGGAGPVLAQDPPGWVDEFKLHVERSDRYSDQQKQESAKLVASLIGDAKDIASTDVCAEALEQLEPEFAAGVGQYRDGNVRDAIARLAPLTESEDRFLATEARFYLAQCHLELDDHESALPLLDGESIAKSVRRGEALFLRGICQAKLLDRETAIKSFAEFLRDHANASERLRVAAWRQLEMLSVVADGSLVDAYQMMEYARRRLSLARADRPTQQRQESTITILDKLIEEAREREAVAEDESEAKKGEGKPKQSSANGGGKEGPGGGADDKSPVKTVRQIQLGTQRSPWDHLRGIKRDAKALAAIKEKYPARYRALIEQYYRSLQDETE